MLVSKTVIHFAAADPNDPSPCDTPNPGSCTAAATAGCTDVTPAADATKFEIRLRKCFVASVSSIAPNEGMVLGLDSRNRQSQQSFYVVLDMFMQSGLY